jgi:hypothetical protein
MHLSTLSLGASNCIDGPLFVCVEKRGSPAPSIAGCMPEHPGGILKRLRHAQGINARELGVYALIRAEVSMNWVLL